MFLFRPIGHTLSCTVLLGNSDRSGNSRELKATTTATATETSPENISLFHLCYFAIISTRSTFTQLANYPGTKLVGVAYKFRNKMKNSPPFVHVLHKTLNLVISRCCFAEDGKEMYQNVKRRTCRAIVFVIKPIVLRRCRCRHRRRCLSSFVYPPFTDVRNLTSLKCCFITF